MNETELLDFRNFLIDQKSSLLNKSSEFKSDSVLKDHVIEDAEQAAIDQSKSVLLHLHERDRKVLHMIEKALSKIESGTYGLCESCDALIGVRRLKARPFANLCIDCMEEQEDPRNLLM